MEHPLLESVPNVSVGRDVATVDALVEATRAGAAAGGRFDGSRAVVADVHRDSDHDRSVLTVLGTGEALATALEELARAAVARLDLGASDGVHPRVGVLDVVPVVALGGEQQAVQCAHQLVSRLGALLGELQVPVVRYGLDDSGRQLPGAGTTAEVRHGGLAALAARIRDGELELVAGPRAPHPSAGVTACGVRDVLVAFNVDLDVDDLQLARSIAARVRARSGAAEALPGVRAIGVRLASRQVAQVSMNLDQPALVGPARALQAVRMLAEEAGAGVSAAELVGLAPDAALVPLRYAATAAGVPLLLPAQPSLERAVASVGAGASDAS